ncbi:hypothetical protein J8L98_18080 [Pseudoalteromonas sp. MMG013]|uniref:hypothetical protein n=1 Tax=Pseudoalteromonas sp. MMG013 TaxID=2822687 RepID=UPI001B359A7C|nr:hypothetical protein [Pseudoalteromonas sp. MMG013]MBQ4863593.1 hypothetical protein [Pseudoalteromonas sp. MMG013]
MKSTIGCIIICITQTGCIFVPKDVTYYDEKCQVYAKKSTLESSNKMITLSACGNEVTCGAALASAGLVSAASLVVSGSISVIANTVYWIEKEKGCITDTQKKVHPKQQLVPKPTDTLHDISVKEEIVTSGRT